MSNLPPTPFALTVRHEPPVLTVQVRGELDYDTSAEFTDTVVDHLSRSEQLRDLRLDFSRLAWIDSSGLSALLMIHRRADAIGAHLHLDNRPEFLDRMLDITNVRDHLTAPAADTAAAADERAEARVPTRAAPSAVRPDSVVRE